MIKRIWLRCIVPSPKSGKAGRQTRSERYITLANKEGIELKDDEVKTKIREMLDST
ncbi:MAG: hypothetical protein WBC40_06535 [Halobacteriota archaeon]